jgi:hypothetical protein
MKHRIIVSFPSLHIEQNMDAKMSDAPENVETSACDGACGKLRKRALRYAGKSYAKASWRMYRFADAKCRALSEESIRKARVAVLQQELALLEKDLARTTPTTQDAVEQLAKSECQQLTNNIMTKLPREIRDMIYMHLSTRDRELIEREHFRTTLDPLTRLYSYDFARWKAQHFPAHYWNPDYVSQAFYCELVENYYRTSTFLFGDDAGVMKRFLNADEMRLGIPPKALVSSVEIGLNAVSHDRGSFRAYMFGIPKSPERMREALDGIFDLRAGAKIVIRFVTEAKTEKEREEHCKGAMAMLFDEAQVEKMKMYKVKFVVDEGQVWDLAEAMKDEWMAMHGQR